MRSLLWVLSNRDTDLSGGAGPPALHSEGMGLYGVGSLGPWAHPRSLWGSLAPVRAMPGAGVSFLYLCDMAALAPTWGPRLSRSEGLLVS